MSILATSTDISADDASAALLSVLAPKKVKTATNSTTTEEDDDEELVNDEETTRNIMDSATKMTDSIMKGWKSGDTEFDMDMLSSLLKATSGITDEYAAITKYNSKKFKKAALTASTASTASTTSTTTTTSTVATTADTATTIVTANDTKVSDYETEK